ncbi:MAG: DegT/DnrJ/EryC1/StrS aminotransferase family protein [Candidatus Rokubacteria bacterium]|nr:DegT/DnrJ/EryC1/StrS aminotransferase family protein [Candidatus Rokubacteria bacterium]
MIPHSRPTLGEEDASRVARVVASGQIAQGPAVAAFERGMADHLGTPAAAAVSSGTAALELALRALSVGAGDEVVIPSFVCDALHHAVTRCGARPVLADADPVTLSIDTADAKRRVTRRTRAMIVPHAFGCPVDVGPFTALGVPVVEDCAQTLAPSGAPAPPGSHGTVAVCSFYATKLLTTGEGGLVAGPEDRVARVRDAREYDERSDLVPRFNYKMTDMAAALGLAQLDRLDAFLARRRAIAARYRARLAGAPCVLPHDAPGHVYHRFVVRVSRPVDGVIAALAARGVGTRRPVFRPLHRALGLADYPEAERAWMETLSLPCYPSLSDAAVDEVATAVREALSA